MNGQKTFARPYAKAIFELAIKDNTLSFWSDTLKLLSLLASDQDLKDTCKNPSYTRQQKCEIFFSVLQKEKCWNTQVENLILLLAQYNRLLLLPYIAMLYEESRAQIEKTINVSVESAHPLSSQIQSKLHDHLKKRLGRDVTLAYKENSSLIGGMIITAGDWVADYSVKNHLEKLKQSLMNE